MSNIYEWLNKEKLRFYKITINKDINDCLVINYHWGSCISNRGGKKDIFVQSEEEVQNYISHMMKRRKSRGYELIST